jgi:predicted MPP superfamily phosphohydrolase
MSRFLRVIVTITVIVHLPFTVAIYDAMRRFDLAGMNAAIAIAATAGILGVTLFVGRARTAMNDAPRSPWRIFLVDVPYYAHWSACVYSIIPAIVYLLLEPIVDLVRGAPIAPQSGFFFWTYVSGLLVCGYGVSIRRDWVVVRHHEVKLRDLDPKFDGYKIAQLSDLHVGALTPGWWAKRWTRAANAEQPDLTVVTGDMVTSGVAFHQDIAEVIGGLRAKDGTFVIMGNHDYFGEGEPLVTLLTQAGTRVLRNEGVVLERDGAKIFLAGTDDTWTKRSNLDRALEDRPPGVPKILLAHDPDRFPKAVERNIDLVLSGHTHGGQIAMPFLSRFINASKLAHHYHVGFYRKDGSTLYVHPGLGTTGPPIRLGVAPAVEIFVLRSDR